MATTKSTEATFEGITSHWMIEIPSNRMIIAVGRESEAGSANTPRWPGHGGRSNPA